MSDDYISWESRLEKADPSYAEGMRAREILRGEQKLNDSSTGWEETPDGGVKMTLFMRNGVVSDTEVTKNIGYLVRKEVSDPDTAITSPQGASEIKVIKLRRDQLENIQAGL